MSEKDGEHHRGRHREKESANSREKEAANGREKEAANGREKGNSRQPLSQRGTPDRFRRSSKYITNNAHIED